MTNTIENIVNMEQHLLQNEGFRKQCKQTLDEHGVLLLKQFLRPSVIDVVKAEGKKNQHLAYFTASNHNIYLKPVDPTLPQTHPRNREVVSSKGCITTDQIPAESALSALYDAPEFRGFLCEVLGESNLYEYADPLSSINLHYASEGRS